MQPQDRLIFPLDVSSRQQAQEFVEKLKHEVGLFKVGLELFLAEGRDFLRYMSEAVPSGFFLDLKFHDIPATVRGAQQQVLTGVKLLTIHVDQGRKLLSTTVAAVQEGVKVLGVTLLTSLDREDLLAMGINPRYAVDPPTELVLLRARLAKEAGCSGVVCAGTEARAVKDEFGEDFLVVCPAIRPQWAAVPGDDQKRVMTPYEAMLAGADYVVVGRPIRLAADPVAAARRVVEEIRQGLADRVGQT